MAPTLAGRLGTRRLVGIGVALPLLLSACGALRVTPEPATPTNFPGLAGRLNAAQITPRDWVSGDAGCTDPDLVPASISFMASGLDQPQPVKLYLYIFRDRPAFERHRAQVGPCAQSFVTDPQTFQEIEQSPYIVAGQGPWAPRFEAALRATLQAAAGTGG
jgi:hypothetical protein